MKDWNWVFCYNCNGLRELVSLVCVEFNLLDFCCFIVWVWGVLKFCKFLCLFLLCGFVVLYLVIELFKILCNVGNMSNVMWRRWKLLFKWFFFIYVDKIMKKIVVEVVDRWIWCMCEIKYGYSILCLSFFIIVINK